MRTDYSPLEKFIENASTIMSQMEEHAFQDERFSELTMRQVLYLNTIIQMGHPTFSDLAKQLGISKPSVTAGVSNLIKKGYVKKVQDHEDLRSFHIVLTPKAEEFNTLHQSVHKQLAEKLGKILTVEEIEQLTCIFNKAIQSLK